MTAVTLLALLIAFSAIPDLLIPGGLLVVSAEQELWLGFIAKYVVFPLIPVVVVGSYCYVGAIRRRVEGHDLLVCTHCGYPLVGLSEHGNCPECGGVYCLPEVRDQWKRWFGSLGRANLP